MNAVQVQPTVDPVTHLIALLPSLDNRFGVLDMSDTVYTLMLCVLAQNARIVALEQLMTEREGDGR